MIYFDNAATGGFKPRAVTDAVYNVTRFLCANPGRSGHRLSITGQELVEKTRNVLGQMFNAESERVIFTKNCTEALNIAILGLVCQDMHVITTVFEHNSVLRPLFNLARRGVITLDVVKPEKELSLVDAIKDKMNKKTKMICLTALSNVTGEVMPIFEVGKLAKEADCYFIVDGAQAGGHIEVDVKKNNISCLALACHKGLYGVMGSGALIMGESVSVSPTFMGGTGSESFNLDQPQSYPDRLECGTLNLPAIAGLLEGARYVKNNMQGFSKILTNATKDLINQLSAIGEVTVVSMPNPAGIVSFSIKDIPSSDVADILNRDYDIAVRAGVHCAPLMHQFLNTMEAGLVRVSLAPQNTSRELNYFIKAIHNIAKN